MQKGITPDRVSTTSLSGKRIKVNPIPVTGKWKNRRNLISWSLIALYLAIPWIRINGHPLLLLDIANRRFSIFGNLFFAHEVPNLIFISLGFFLWIGLVTALLGRVWCGWTCPQTVFIETIYRKIEVWLEGDLSQKKTTTTNAIKWTLYLIVSVILSHSFLAYFVGSSESFKMILTSPIEHWQSFLVVWILVGIVMFDFGWFREQFCLIACPYGRFQSLMMDPASLYVAYDEKRGDCIDCLKCVRVCPTGIDIRDGLQFECIACTACMDACDSVMKKINKPEKLISYKSEISLAGNKNPWIRGRTLIYGMLLFGVVFGLNYRLNVRKVYQTEVSRAKDTPYQVITQANGESVVINHYHARFYNLDWNTVEAKLEPTEETKNLGIEFVMSGNQGQEQNIESGKSKELQFFLKIPKTLFDEINKTSGANPKATINVLWSRPGILPEVKEVTLLGPGIHF